MNFLHGFSLVTSSTLLVFAVGFANAVLLADQLGPGQWGRLSLWATTLLLGSLLLGEWLNKGCTFIVGRQRARGAALAVTLVYSLVLGGLLLALAPVALFLCASRLPGVTAPQLYLMAGLLALTVLEKGALAILLGEERLKAYALIPVTFVGAYFLGNVLLAGTAGLTVGRVLGAWLAAVGLSSVAACWLLARGGLPVGGSVRQSFVRMVRIGARAEVALVLTFLLLKSDVYLITWFMGEEAVGVYRVANNFTDMMQRVPNVASVIVFAKVVRGQESPRLSLRVGQTMILFWLVSAIVLVGLGPALLHLFFPRYPDAYGPLVWLLPGMLFMGIGSVFNARLIGEGYPPVTIWAPALALALNVGLNLWLIPRLGLRGAAVSTSIAYALWGILVTAYYLHRTGTSWWQILRLPPLRSMLNRVWSGRL